MRTALLLSFGLLFAPAIAAACPSPSADPATFERLRQGDFAIAESGQRHRLALALLPCLEARDPALRDGTALAALTAWMRGGLLDEATLRELREHGYARLHAPDPAGFGPPFAALMLAEIARTDRRAPWMGDDERVAMVAQAARYLAGIRDYRGYDSRDGWRHGIAHGADWLMQLALNPALDRAQLDPLLAAVASQVLPPAPHAYVEGEYERLARPVLYAARRGLHDEDYWRHWLSGLTARLDEAGPAWNDRDWLVRRHNLLTFLAALNAQLDLAPDPALAPLHQALRTALRTLG